MRAITEGAGETEGRETTIGAFRLTDGGEDADGDGLRCVQDGSGWVPPKPVWAGVLGLTTTGSRSPPALRGTLMSFGFAMEPATWLPEPVTRLSREEIAGFATTPSRREVVTGSWETFCRAFAPLLLLTTMGARGEEGVIEVNRAGLEEAALPPEGCDPCGRISERAVTGTAGAPIFDAANVGRETVSVRPSASRFSRREPRSRTAEPFFKATWRMSPRVTFATRSCPMPLLMIVLLLPAM